MAADSGGTKKPSRTTRATPKKPAKRTSATSAKSANDASTPAAKPARSTSRAKPAKGASAAKGTSAAKPPRTPSAAKESAAAKKSASAAKRASVGKSATKPAKPAAGRARRAPAAEPAAPAQPIPPARPAVAEVKDTVAAGTSAKRALVEGTARSYHDALAARDVEAAVGLWRDDAVDDIVPFGILRGSAAIKGFLQEIFGAMPDARFTVDRVIADEKGAAVRWRVVGTFSGASFQGLEPTGSRIDLRGIDNLEIEDGRIVHNTGVFDGAAFARQVGLLPPEDSGADRAIRAGFNAVTKLRRSVSKRASR